MVSRFARLFVLLFLLVFVAGFHGAQGALITSFDGAFQLTTPAPGWSYLWNSAGPIGDPANYALLLPNSSGVYTTDGSDAIPAPAPANYLNLSLPGGFPGGHPGMGALQDGSGGIERYCIAAYTLASAETVSIHSGFVKNINPNSGGSTDGVSVKVFVNDNPLPALSGGTAPGFESTTTFSVALGALNAGDKVYVAIGSKDTDLFDGFHLRYDVVAVPEPATYLTAVTALVTVAGVVGSRRQRSAQVTHVATGGARPTCS